MTFASEAKFEDALIHILQQKGWEDKVINHPTEQDLIDNWARILFENNRGIDRLNNVPLTDSEMQQLIEQINTLKTPLKLNGFINGKTVAITRDNPDDPLHLGKEISLKIYDRHEIAAGQSRYQIVKQPQFPTKSPVLRDRRGDLMLLINGMPVFHIELKRSGVSVSQACLQIEKYAEAGIFTGLFALVQIFVAMNPEESVYFANPDGNFNDDYYFSWANFYNEPYTSYKEIAASLLSIPMAHQMIGFYTVADKADGVLKVMRSYQYYAANAISDKVSTTKWQDANSQLGGYIWHTTGSGKTMTSFKSAQLIASSQDADKVIFLMDRIELGTQSFIQYQNFADDKEGVQDTDDTYALIGKIKSSDPKDTLIVTSIQKMSNIEEDSSGMNTHDLSVMQDKRLVFIIDEAHRSTFGDMLKIIKQTFPNAIFFGFTGTPIHDENQRKMNTTADIFGDELHRYSIADGIRDENVLGFDLYRVATFKDKGVRCAVALQQAKASTESEALADDKKREKYYEFMNDVAMAGQSQADGTYTKGIEDYLPKEQYLTAEHQNMVVEDILDNFPTLSRGGKFHAIFATSSIVEAITYYRLLKAQIETRELSLRISALFDANEGNEATSIFKEKGMAEIITDYNTQFEKDFKIASHSKFKKDIASRLSHKEPYQFVERKPDQQLDILIVVEQMLTGFDSKWVNTLYIDKLIRYENIIQAFSRTNRLFGHEKPFGTIRYYRKPYTMERNINAAIKLYSGDKPIGLFADKLESNLAKMNSVFAEIQAVFSAAGIAKFEALPSAEASQAKFSKLFKKLNDHLEAADIQGFTWDKLSYDFEDNSVTLSFDEQTYLVLAMRYKELFQGGSSGGSSDVPFDISGHLTQINTDRIDSEYLNERFDKYIESLELGDADQALNELHKAFPTLSSDEQKHAKIFLNDVHRGKIKVKAGTTFKDYIVDYQVKDQNNNIHKFAYSLGLDESKLRMLLDSAVTEASINEFGRFDELKNSVDKDKAKAYFEALEGSSIPMSKVNIKIDAALRTFILSSEYT
ncbi:type I restriction endonuclease subunit R [Psychrobacter sp. Ps1]|uniref:type I restriction endonuclease subunit R n=1 Tax=Psychrobacter sp. Ps1 TaxID=2790955 RepID=UPI001EDE9217|nr:HsdR family type I site-specific deoxyribonuclease [Psychrobacter sp. Ps1]MCG3841910.1 type I restriction endonuclease subunit R [Psychrobacter sp. Ps1]